ncbi:MAG: right-handed parallel beta-helix repeat-containing protein [Acidimicrobiales bacterium]
MATGVAGIVFSPTAAHAAVTCGSSITVHTTLTSDLVCPGNGLVVNASGVILNLGGHTISGVQAPEEQFGTSGVIVNSNRSGVIVRNGTIRGFNRGVSVNTGANNALVTGLTLDANAAGIGIFGNPTSVSGARLVSNTITNTTRFSGIQMTGTGHRVEANTIANGASTGILFNGHDHVVQANTITDAGQNGIALGPFPSTPGPFNRNQILANKIVRQARVGPQASGINLQTGVDTAVTGNIVDGRSTAGGVSVFDSTGTRVAQNQVTSSNSGVSVSGVSAGTHLLSNIVTANRNGVFVGSGTTGNVLERNLSSSNQFDGMNVTSAGSVLTGNVAYRNGAFGIRAVNGVTDGGGNRAFANGQGQCSPSISCA